MFIYFRGACRSVPVPHATSRVGLCGSLQENNLKLIFPDRVAVVLPVNLKVWPPILTFTGDSDPILSLIVKQHRVTAPRVLSMTDPDDSLNGFG
jgi:hypothetical protein